MTDWKTRHDEARRTPRDPIERALVGLLNNARLYAVTHEARYHAPIGEDYVLGPAVQDILTAIRVLLNGELGRLDGGELDRELVTLAEAHGLTLD